MKIVSVRQGTQADEKGLQVGDRIVEINGGPARDQIDLLFYGSDDDIRLVIHRGTYEFMVVLDGTEDYGIELEPMEVKLCGNNCIFCFVDQNPPGMRKTIYVKDEDYRLSFLHGSYVTLSNLGDFDVQRIISQRLSPLYVSVHATDVETRLKMLGIRKSDNFEKTMNRLLSSGIEMHCQIVVCPGINDGTVLHRTIHDLRRRYPRILSVAVVPVGLTKHREGLYHLQAVDKYMAQAIIELVEGLHGQYRAETDDGFVYCSDELYIRAGADIPEAEYYDEYPQIENGVGMVRDFIDAQENLEERAGGGLKRTGSFVFVTGVSMSLYIGEFAARMSGFPEIRARVVTVENRFFGDMVTVSGLLTGRDIRDALGDVSPEETVVLPPNCLNDDGLFLDNLNPSDISKSLGVDVILGEYDPVSVFFA